VRLLFAEPVGKLTGTRQRSRHGNRHETRTLLVSSDLNAWADWPHLGQVGQLTYRCECRGKVSQETSYLITSLSKEQASPGQLLRLMRGHWGIENRVHWVRDVTFDEDRSQVRVGSGPQAMAALRNTALGLLRLKGVRNIAAATRTCAWHAERALALVTSRRRITQ
jgi:hypothetical protein